MTAAGWRSSSSTSIRFKTINVAQPYPIGDGLLSGVAAARRGGPGGGLPWRGSGGDEFLVYNVFADDENQAAAVGGGSRSVR